MATLPNYAPAPFAPATTGGLFDPIRPPPQRPRPSFSAEEDARLTAIRRAAMLQMERPARPPSGVPFSQRLIAQGRPSENVQVKPRTAKFDPASLVMAGADLLLNMVLRAPMGPKPPVSLAMERAAARDRDRLRLARQRSNIGP
jgi:hypothetical protein